MIRRNGSLLVAVAMLAAACTTGEDTTQPDNSDASTNSSAAVLDPASIICNVSGGFDAIGVQWSGVPAGADVVILRDGEEIHSTTASSAFEDLGGTVGETHKYSLLVGASGLDVACGSAILAPEVGQPQCSVSVDTFAIVTWDLFGGRAEVYRNGERVLPDRGTLSSPFIDTAAPVDLPLSYEVVAVDSSGQERPSKTASCGVVTVDALPPEETALQIAQEAARAYRAPYGYATIVPICSECPTEKIDVYYAFDNVERVPVKTWIGDVERNVTDDIWFTDPLAVPSLLLQALAVGDDIVAITDPDTGLVVQWSVNGEGAILECLEMDMAPLDLRQKDCSGSVYTD